MYLGKITLFTVRKHPHKKMVQRDRNVYLLMRFSDSITAPNLTRTHYRQPMNYFTVLPQGLHTPSILHNLYMIHRLELETKYVVTFLLLNALTRYFY